MDKFLVVHTSCVWVNVYLLVYINENNDMSLFKTIFIVNVALNIREEIKAWYTAYLLKPDSKPTSSLPSIFYVTHLPQYVYTWVT